MSLIERADFETISCGEYIPPDLTKAMVEVHRMIKTKDNKALLALLKRLPKVLVEEEVPRFYIDGVEVDQGVWFQSNGKQDTWITGVHTATGMPVLPVDAWKSTLR